MIKNIKYKSIFHIHGKIEFQERAFLLCVHLLFPFFCCPYMNASHQNYGDGHMKNKAA